MPSEFHLRPETAEVFHRLDTMGLMQRDLAAALKLEPNKVSKIRTGERQFKAHELLEARAWLYEKEQERLRAAPEERGERPDIPPTRSASGEDTVEILSLDLSYAMGDGTNIDDYVEEEPVRFDLGFIRQISRSPATRLRLARGIGDSMLPTLQSYDRVMIDTTQNMLKLDDRIYAISRFGAGSIKRLQAVGPSRILIKSDNPDIENVEVDAEDLIIHGRVIWFARDL
jgi:phage repressor protein C with HTH and peptisase S24 domain